MEKDVGRRRVVVKVGSALIAPDGDGCRNRYLLPIARLLGEWMREGREVILVSSGAVAAGAGVLPPRQKRGPRTLAEKQALAAVGQSLMIAGWAKLLDVPVAQMLLTQDDLQHRRRFINAKNTLGELLKQQVLPIVNENDTVAVAELKVGDNDNLAAHVACAAEADLLVILSDVDGLFDADPRKHADASLIAEVAQVDERIYAMAGGVGGAFATGGMLTKIQAAEKATAFGVDVQIVNGTKPAALDALIAGQSPGTLFRRTANPLAAKKHWMLHTLPTAGRIEVDLGAVRAIREQGASLLPSGVIGVDGVFRHGDAVEVVYRDAGLRHVLAKGLTQYSADSLLRIKGRHSHEMAAILGYVYTDVVIHRGDMVLVEQEPACV